MCRVVSTHASQSIYDFCSHFEERRGGKFSLSGKCVGNENFMFLKVLIG